MKNKIDELQNAATLLKLDYKIISGNEANDIINKIFNIYKPFKIKGHLSIENDNSTKLKTDENEFTFSYDYLPSQPIYIFFEQDDINRDKIFVLKNGNILSEILNECFGMEYFISNETFDFLISVNWYVIEIVQNIKNS